MRRAVKAVIPPPVLRMAVAVKDAMLLAATARQDFDTENLRPARTLDIPNTLADANVEAGWSEDRRMIAAIFDDEDRFESVNPGDRRALYALVLGLRPRNVLEIGTNIGASTIHIAAALKRLGDGGTVTTVDIIDVNGTHGPWREADMARPPRETARLLDLPVTFEVFRSLEFMATTDRRYDLIFLDGNHSAPSVYREVSSALHLLRESGLIVLHDYYPGGRALYPDGATIRGPFQAVQRIRRECPAIMVMPLGGLPWATKQGTNVTTLALIAKAG
jgi:predicted O-methyltransferase YrrM